MSFGIFVTCAWQAIIDKINSIAAKAHYSSIMYVFFPQIIRAVYWKTNPHHSRHHHHTNPRHLHHIRHLWEVEQAVEMWVDQPAAVAWTHTDAVLIMGLVPAEAALEAAVAAPVAMIANPMTTVRRLSRKMTMAATGRRILLRPIRTVRCSPSGKRKPERYSRGRKCFNWSRHLIWKGKIWCYIW